MNKKRFADMTYAELKRICRKNKLNPAGQFGFGCANCPLSIKTLPEDATNVDAFCYLRVWEKMYISFPKEEYKTAAILRRCADKEIEIPDLEKRKKKKKERRYCMKAKDIFKIRAGWHTFVIDGKRMTFDEAIKNHSDDEIVYQKTDYEKHEIVLITDKNAH